MVLSNPVRGLFSCLLVLLLPSPAFTQTYNLEIVPGVTDAYTYDAFTPTVNVRDSSTSNIATGINQDVYLTLQQTSSELYGEVKYATSSGTVATSIATPRSSGTFEVIAFCPNLAGPAPANSSAGLAVSSSITASRTIYTIAETIGGPYAQGQSFTVALEAQSGGSKNTGVTNEVRIVAVDGSSNPVSLSGTTTTNFVAGDASFSVSTTFLGTIYFRSIVVDSTSGNDLITSHSTAVVIQAGSATKLSFSTQPFGASAGSALTTQPVVQALDSYGNLVTSFTSTVTLTLKSPHTADATVGSMSASSGVASFSGVTIPSTSLALRGYRIEASATGVATVSSFPFSVSGDGGLTADAVVFVNYGGENFETAHESANSLQLGQTFSVTVRVEDSAKGLPVGGVPGFDGLASGGLGGIGQVFKYSRWRGSDSGDHQEETMSDATITLAVHSSATATLVGTLTRRPDRFGMATFEGLYLSAGSGNVTFEATCSSGCSGTPSVQTDIISVSTSTGSVLASVPSSASEGSVSEYTLQLGSEPADTVTIALSLTSGTGSVAPTSLTFSSADWMLPKTVAVQSTTSTASNTAETVTLQVTHTATSNDPNYVTAAIRWSPPFPATSTNVLDVPFTETLVPTVTISPSSATVLEGSSVTYDIFFNHQPHTDPTVMNIGGSTVNIAQSSWTDATTAVYTHTVTTTNDGVDNGSPPTVNSVQNSVTSYTVTFSPSAYFYYATLDATTSAVTVTAGSTLRIDNEGTITGTVSIQLSAVPTATVTVALACDSAAVAQTAASVDLTTTTWNSNQNIDLTGVSASTPTGNSFKTTCTLSATSTDARYSGTAAVFTPSNEIAIVVVRRQCTVGLYGTSCTNCPAGSECYGAISSTCPSGYYSAAGDGFCRACPPGSACTTPAASVTACSGTGQYAVGYSTSCSTPVAGKQFTTSSTHPVPCLLGMYWDNTAFTCTLCPAGSRCTDPTSSTPVACGTGEYSKGGAILCKKCPAGFSCATTSAEPAPCAPGTYATGGATSCTSCTAGNECPYPDRAVQIACAAGYYALAGASTCRLCDVGVECAATTSAGSACATGTYSLGGQTSCTACPAGFYCPAVNRPPVLCPGGTYSTGSASSCNACTTGCVCDEGSTAACPSSSQCPKGFYCAGGEPVPCGGGTYQASAGATASTACTTCTAGYFCPRATAEVAKGMLECPMGHYCPAGSDVPTRCGADTYRNDYMGTAAGDCTACPNGYFSGTSAATDATTVQCYPAPAGTWWVSGTAGEQAVTAGSYTGKAYALESTDTLPSCPAGSYCPAGSAAPTRCAPGTYSTATGQTASTACGNCDTGYACPQYGTRGVFVRCAHGHYCEAGTRWPDEIPCPRGTWLAEHTGTASSSCTQCPAGFACDHGTGGPHFPPQPCAAGHYCTAGTEYPTQNACAAGTFSPHTGLTAASECTKCPPGKYCTGGKPAPDGDCLPGHFCPESSSDPLANPCAQGSYSPDWGLTSQDHCLPCPEGSFCPPGSPFPEPCPVGSYSLNTNTTGTMGLITSPGSLRANTFSQCETCPAGYECPVGAIEAIACGRGYYSAAGAGACTICPAGSYCDSETTTDSDIGTKVCNSASLDCSTTGIDYTTTMGSRPCPLGHICYDGATNTAATVPSEVSAGFIVDFPGVTSAALFGYYVNTTGQWELTGQCDPHYLCPEASSNSTPTLCPAGYYRPLVGGRHNLGSSDSSEGLTAPLGQCSLCPAGFYCPMSSSTQTVVDCPTGSYCPEGSSTPTGCTAGYFGTQTNTREASDCTPCTPGMYCGSTGLTAPTANCSAGFLCYLGSTSATPTDGTTGTTCTAGGYCTEGGLVKASCPAGTYNPFAGAFDTSLCTTCTAGSYCTGSAETAPNGQCYAGYYCLTGSTTPTQNIVPAGAYSIAGDGIDTNGGTSCPQGYYQPNAGQSSCLDCPARQYCPSTGMTTTYNCPTSNYCEARTILTVPCPAGTYSAANLLSSSNDCNRCDPGKYCSSTGQAAVGGDCSAGYYCAYQSSSQTPSSTTDQSGPCPAGYYCIAGSVNPVPCASSTFRATTLATASGDCTQCSAGSYCLGVGLSAVTASCPAGYFCPTGTDDYSANPCTVGNACPAGASGETACTGGTYAEATRTDSCLTTPAGYYTGASASSFANDCQAGHYCVAGSSSATAAACAAGTFSNNTNAKAADWCLDCQPGKYCPSTATTAPANCDAGYYCTGASTTNIPSSAPEGGQCAAGTYCPAGSVASVTCDAGSYCSTAGLGSPQASCPAGYYCPAGTSTSTSNPCTAGHYCPLGSSTPVACPPGTFLASTQNDALADCTTCTGGSYCESSGLTAVTGPCSAGFYCPAGSSAFRPSGSICPAGSSCSAGVASPSGCSSGNYQPLTGQSSCDACPAGRYCNSTDALSCETGKYCTGSNTQASQSDCATGTFNDIVGRSASSECQSCLPGTYCGSTGLSAPTGDCTAGYYCTGGTTSATPSSNGGQCTTGTYCPTGSPEAVVCPAGYYCSGSGRTTPNAKCTAGYFCHWGATWPTPTHRSWDATVCPSTASGAASWQRGGMCLQGTFCESGAVVPIACPAGTYGTANLATSVLDCATCPAGQYCYGFGLTAVSGNCEAGFYCRAGQSAMFDVICPVGQYCPEQSSAATNCSAGTYNAFVAQANCTNCPPGTLCASEMMTSPSECPTGSYCGTATSSATACSAGTYQPLTHQTTSDSCVGCYPGQYCTGTGRSDNGTACTAGYYCRFGSSSATPTNTSCSGTGYNLCLPGSRCPENTYCPAGSSVPTACPLGTTGAAAGSTASTDCSACPAGSYCAADAVPRTCDAGFVCSSGAKSPRPIDGTTGYICPVGHYCTAGTTTGETNCADGTYADVTGLETCHSCPAGHYCNATGGTITPTECPAGYVCPAGASAPTACGAGTFNPLTKKTNATTDCLPCESGKYCATAGLSAATGSCTAGYFCAQETSGNTSPTPSGTYPSSGTCPAGYYCEAGTPEPTPCPAGRYRAGTMGTALSDCTLCDAGSYCATMNQTATTGQCEAGYYCSSGSKTISGGTKGSDSSSVYVCAEGSTCICPFGHTCATGTGTPAQCPGGTYGNTLGQTTCQTCYVSHYCAAATTTPVSCTAGNYCPNATETPIPCPNGTYDSTTRYMRASDQCSDCEPGYYCTGGGALDTNKVCDVGYICVKGVSSAAPPRNYTDLTFTGAVPSEWGGLCPPGHYCGPTNTVRITTPTACSSGTVRLEPGGISQNDCGACPLGYYCRENMLIPEACPMGGWCVQNATEPAWCPIGYYQPLTLQTSNTSCTLCPAGYACLPSDNDFYPLGSFGSYPAYGIQTLDAWICRPGMYCTGGTNAPQLCGTGTNSNVTGVVSAAGCLACPAGVYCTNGFGLTNSPSGRDLVLDPRACPGGNYCVENSTSYSQCPAGTYCEPLSSATTACTQGYYCEAGSAYRVPCPEGAYCVASATAPTYCPAGSRGLRGQTTAIKKDGCSTGEICACESCESGYYSDGSPVFECTECPAGFVCEVGTSTAAPQTLAADGGYPCPVGHYCPSGSSFGLACPEGTFRAVTKGEALTDCSGCPENTFNEKTGQNGCFPCGSTSTAVVGSTTCVCDGLNRTFSAYDGTCTCSTGFEFIDDNLVTRSNEDSSIDCQPIVYPSCASSSSSNSGSDPDQTGAPQSSSGMVRLANGTCVEYSTIDCASECNGGAGTFISNVGRCQCENVQVATVVCDSTCQLEMYKVFYNETSEELKFMNQTDKTNKTMPLSYLNSDGEALWSLSCNTRSNATNSTQTGEQECELSFGQTTSDGSAEGLFGPNADLITRLEAYLANTTSSRRRRLEEIHDIDVSLIEDPEEAALLRRLQTASTTGITNPVLCIKVESSYCWYIQNRNFPIYEQDNLLNTNPNFDAGPFRQLQTVMEAGGAAASRMKYFCNTFREAGTYVFSMSEQPSNIQIMNVVGSGTVCPDSSTTPQSQTASSYASSGTSTSSTVNIEPSYLLLGILLGGLLLLAGLLAGIVTYARRRVWLKYAARGISEPEPWVFGKKKNYKDFSQIGVDDLVEGGFTDQEAQKWMEERKEMAAREEQNRKVLGMSPEDLDTYLSRYNDEKFDVRVYQAAYEKLMNHHKFVNAMFGKRNEDADEQAEKTLGAAQALQSAIEARLQEVLENLQQSNEKRTSEREKLNECSEKVSPLLDDDGSKQEVDKTQFTASDPNDADHFDPLAALQNELQDDESSIEEKMEQLKRLSEAMATTTDEDERQRLLDLYNQIMASVQKQHTHMHSGAENARMAEQQERNEQLKKVKQERQDMEAKVQSMGDKMSDDRDNFNEKQDKERREERTAVNDDLLANCQDMLAEENEERDSLLRDLKKKLDDPNLTQEEKDNLIRAANDRLDALNESLEEEREAQLAKMHEALQARKAKRQRQREEERKRNDEAREAAALQAKEDLAALKATELQQRQQNEIDLLMGEQTALEMQEGENLDRKFRDKTERLQEELQKDFESRLDGLKREGLSNDEFLREKTKLQEELHARLEDLDDIMEAEKRKQADSIEQALQARKLRRAKAVEARQSAENQLLEFEARAQKEMEHLRQRQAKERSEAQEAFEKKKEAMQSEADFTLQAQLANLQGAFDAKIVKLRAQKLEHPERAAEIDAEMAALNEQYKIEKGALLDNYERDLRAELDIAAKDYEVDMSKMANRHEREWDELTERHREEEAAIRDRIAHLQHGELIVVQQNAEESLEQKLDQEYKDKDQEQRRLAERERKRAHEEEERKTKSRLNAATSDAERERIKEEHRQKLEKIDNMLEEERMKQNEELKRRLRERRDKRKDLLAKKHEAEQEALRLKAEQDAQARELEHQQESDRKRDEIAREHERLGELAVQDAGELGQTDNLRQALDDMEPALERQRKKLYEGALGSRDAEGEREALLAAWRLNMAKQADEDEAERLRQKQNMQARLKERRSRLQQQQAGQKKEMKVAQAFERVAAEEVLDNRRKEERAYREAGDGDAKPNAMRQLAYLQQKGQQAKWKEDLKSQQEKDMSEFKSKLDAERDQFQREMEAQLATEREAIAQARQQKEKELEAQRARAEIDNQVALAEAGNDEEKRKRLLEAHKRRVEDLENVMNRETAEQEEKMQKKLEARRAKLRAKKEALEAKQQHEISEKEIDQQRNAQEKLAEVQKEEEDAEAEREQNRLTLQAAATVAAYTSSAEKSQLKRDTELALSKMKANLDMRHAQETENRVALQYSEKAHRLRVVMDSEQKNKAQKLVDYQGDLDNAHATQTDTTGIMSPAARQKKYAEKEEELEKQLQLKMEDLRNRLDREHAEELMNIRERQLEQVISQISGFLTKVDRQANEMGTSPLSPEARRQAEGWVESARREKTQLVEVRNQKRAEVAEKIKEIQDAMKERELAVKQQVEDQLAKMKEKLEQEREEARALAEARLRQKRDEHRKTRILQQNQHLQNVLAKQDAKRATLMAEHQSDLSMLERNLDVERQRQLTKMEKRLADRQKAKEKKFTEERMRQLHAEQSELRREQERLFEQEMSLKQKQKKALDNIRLKSSSLVSSKLSKWKSKAVSKVSDRQSRLGDSSNRMGELEDDSDPEDEFADETELDAISGKPTAGQTRAPSRQSGQSLSTRLAHKAREIKRVETQANRVRSMLSDFVSKIDEDEEKEDEAEGAQFGLLGRDFRVNVKSSKTPEDEVTELLQTLEQVNQLIHMVKLAATVNAGGGEGFRGAASRLAKKSGVATGLKGRGGTNVGGGGDRSPPGRSAEGLVKAVALLGAASSSESPNSQKSPGLRPPSATSASGAAAAGASSPVPSGTATSQKMEGAFKAAALLAGGAGPERESSLKLDRGRSVKFDEKPPRSSREGR
uniref:Tyrosine-protein kinase ephrin type A/B receptor-like domain-containing protein n=1 Tax=Chromera velia CCMP2878 TaxID=1169474 RepID=A0A0G4HJ42_9ALVE|eukprot:Cvel_1096.t1-p1 / transcript=Cvel_1096.t1 / gene=Cvel_1096 / organism=Chromera_velia_CCMP2878 / gene_product=Mucin-19, putative / transcript_product=Mucin-19, putative / location=Cvel_scaffold35:129459-155153(+) / protein_length=5861 / sequence_SO=supercontig / SO=protein_coding / is_pseudo=false